MTDNDEVLPATVWEACKHDPDATTATFPSRDTADLPYDPAAFAPDASVLLDTTVYLDSAAGRLPPAIATFLRLREVLHSSVAIAEIAVSVGILDPANPLTSRHRPPLVNLLTTIATSSCRAPSPLAWAEAGILSGILARTQLGLAKAKSSGTAPFEECCQRGRRREILHDALIFLTAVEHRAILVSANRRDMDLLLRFRPDASVLLYHPQSGANGTGT